MSTQQKMKVGMVGVRAYAGYRRARLKESGLYDIVAAYNRSREPLIELQKTEGIQPAFTYEELLDVPGLEAIIVSSGATSHAEQTVAALNRGLHVFVEKPLCSTMEEVRALLEAQQRTGLVVAMGHVDHRHDKISQTIKKQIDSGRLGKIAVFEKTTAHSGGFLIQPGDWRGDPNKNPGGMLFQCGVHAFHELMFYFGPIAEVFAQMRSDVHTTPTADVALVQVKFESGLIGTVHAYHVTAYRHSLNIFGTKATIYRDDRFFDEGTKLMIQEVPPVLDGRKEPVVPLVPEGETDQCGNVRSFYDTVRNGGRPYPYLLDGCRAVAAVFAAEKSARTGRSEKVEPIPDSAYRDWTPKR